MHDIDVRVSEVGLRDGLQNVSQTLPTACKKRWIGAAGAAGLREIEGCSFVPSRVPQAGLAWGFQPATRLRSAA